MPFKQVFERNVNKNMQEGGQTSRSDQVDESDIKRHHDSKEHEFEVEDEEISEKKDRPPRFSTLFGATPPPPQIIERYVEPKQKSGVYLPMPLFIVLALILFFESTLLFAYTVIGLYKNVPPGLLPFGDASTTVVDGCNCLEKQAAVNIAPNFFLGTPQGEAVAPSVNVMPLPNVLSTSTTQTTSSKTKSSTSSIDTAGYASALAGMFDGNNPSPSVQTTVVTATPEQKTVDVTIMSTITDGGPPPTTSTVFVDPKRGVSANKKRTSIDAAESEKETLTPKSTPSPTTLVTAASPTETKEKDKPSPTKGADSDADDDESDTDDDHCWGGWMETQWCGTKRS